MLQKSKATGHVKFPTDIPTDSSYTVWSQSFDPGAQKCVNIEMSRDGMMGKQTATYYKTRLDDGLTKYKNP